jgi:hypothetical protein
MCGRGYELRGGALEEIPLAYAMPEAAHTERPLYLPFWWFRISLGFSSSTPSSDTSRVERMENVYVTAFAVRGLPFSDDPGFLFTQRQVAPSVKTTLREPALGGTITSAQARCWVPLTLLSLADRAGEDRPGAGAPMSFKTLEERLLAVPFYDEGAHLVDGLISGRYLKDSFADARSIEAVWSSLARARRIKEARGKPA